MRIAAIVLCGVLCAASQEPAGSEVAQQDAPATFKSKVNVVLVPVVVRDRHGRAADNLRKEDFQLFDKGKAQTISTFSIEKSGGVRPAAAAPAPGAPATEKPPAAPERFTAYLFDDLHLNFSDLVRSRDAASKHLDTTFEAGDRAAIFSTSGQTMLDFTDDRAKMQETLLRLRPRSMATNGVQECPDISHYQADLIIEKSDREALGVATDEVLACEAMDKNLRGLAEKIALTAARRVLDMSTQETRVALDVLKDVVRRISMSPGRRSIVLISPGFLTPSQWQEKSEIIDRAIRANVVVSALDARGLYALIPGGDASQRTYNFSPIKDTYVRTNAQLSASVMAELSEGTGGSFFQNNNDLAGGLKKLSATPEAIYVLGFSPQNLKLDGAFHRLKVTLKDGAGLAVQARRGYYAPTHLEDQNEQAKREIEEALFSREELNDLPVELHTQFFKASEYDARLSVLARIDLTQIKYRKVDGRNGNELTITSGLFDRNGNYVTAMQKILTLRLRDATLQSRAASGITVKTSFDVKPGGYAIRLVVRDAEGQLMSAQNGAIEIP
ncbi:MAG: VWA domain-containing protein [Acidobacteriota bacterium]